MLSFQLTINTFFGKTEWTGFIFEHARIAPFVPTCIHQLPFSSFVKRHPAADKNKKTFILYDFCSEYN